MGPVILMLLLSIQINVTAKDESMKMRDILSAISLQGVQVNKKLETFVNNYIQNNGGMERFNEELKKQKAPAPPPVLTNPYPKPVPQQQQQQQQQQYHHNPPQHTRPAPTPNMNQRQSTAPSVLYCFQIKEFMFFLFDKLY